MEKETEKYASYAQGYKPVGYAQMYDLRKHDYPTDFKLDDFSEKLARIDVFCGEVKVLGNGLGIL